MNFGHLTDEQISDLANVLLDTDDDIYMGLDQLGINSRSKLLDIKNITWRLNQLITQDPDSGYWHGSSE